MPKPEFNLAGTVPEVHGMAAARKALYDNPREEVWVVGRVVNLADTRHHPTDEPSQRTYVLKFTSIDAILIGDDINTVTEVVARARAERPGQGDLLIDGATSGTAAKGESQEAG